MPKFTRLEKGAMRAVILSIEIDLQQGVLGQLTAEQVKSNIEARLATLKESVQERDR
jgi:hypothetical protein